MSEDASRAWKDQYMLRFPDGMRDRIKDAAEANKRSMNSEIIARLEASFALDGTMATHESEMAEIKRTVNELKIAFALMRSEQKPKP